MLQTAKAWAFYFPCFCGSCRRVASCFFSSRSTPLKMIKWTRRCAEIFAVLSAILADVAVGDSVYEFAPRRGNGSQWQEKEGSLGESSLPQQASFAGSQPRQLQPWRGRSSMGTRAFSGGYTGYGGMGGATYTGRASPYGGGYGSSMPYAQRATPGYMGSGSGYTAGRTPYYGGSGTTAAYTGSNTARSAYPGYSGSSQAGGSPTYVGSSGTPYSSGSGSPFSGAAYPRSSSPYTNTMASRTGGLDNDFGTIGGGAQSAGRIPYPTGATTGTRFGGVPTGASGLHSSGGMSGSGTTFFGTSSASHHGPSNASSNSTQGFSTGTSRTRPTGAQGGVFHNTNHTALGGTLDDSTSEIGPFRDPSRGRGSSSFRASGGAATQSPIEQSPVVPEGTTYYLREADGTLTPIEPPPYDQMKPDSYYTELYLTDKPIRFENQVSLL